MLFIFRLLISFFHSFYWSNVADPQAGKKEDRDLITIMDQYGLKIGSTLNTTRPSFLCNLTNIGMQVLSLRSIRKVIVTSTLNLNIKY